MSNNQGSMLHLQFANKADIFDCIMFKTISDSSDPVLSDVKPLYENAFPIHERRTLEALTPILNEPKIHLKAIMLHERFIGFAIYWKPEDWLYLEQLAITPEFRGKKHGKKVIEYLKHVAGQKLILETELPETDEAVRRIRFYERLGLKAVNYPYKQPPYRKEESPFPMLLMSAVEVNEEECNRVVNMIRYEVYERFY